MEMALIEAFCSNYANKKKRYLSSHWYLSLLHYSVTFKHFLVNTLEPVNHLLLLKWQSFLKLSFVCQILAGEWTDKKTN